MTGNNHFLLILIVLLTTIAALFAADGELVILHTNDIHGAFLPQPARWVDGNPPIGGFAPLSGAIVQEKQVGFPILLLDAGDFMTGNPIADLEVNGVIGSAMLEFFDLMDYDATTLGNHEFDITIMNVMALVEKSKVPIKRNGS